jgi:drug/metabolite transporter (DMT)-like permease
VALGVAAVWLASEGDIQLAKALRSLPEGGVLAAAMYPPMWAAVSLLAAHFFLWLRVLAVLDLSVAVPLTACNYIFNAILVQWRLGESVTSRTWLGTSLIALGVVLVTASSQDKETSA